MSILRKEVSTPTEEKNPVPKEHSSGSRSGTYYKIEVRSWSRDPKVLHDAARPQHPFIIDKDWREWPVALTCAAGTPSMPVGHFDRAPAEHGLLTYAAAMGHLWGVYASLAAAHLDLCVQARLVACKYHEAYTITEESVSDVIALPRRPLDVFMPRDQANEKALIQQD